MNTSNTIQRAAELHGQLPLRLRQYLNARGISDPLVDFFLLGWDGSRITIPVFARDGEVAFFKLAKDPDDTGDAPKMLATPGAKMELYGWDDVLYHPEEIVICEGEFDRLVLKAQGFRSVTSTGGARAFWPEWAKYFEPIAKVYICFDRDEAGREGALHVGQLIPHARIVELPEEVGEGGDVTDFFVRLGRTDEEFRKLFEQAVPVPPPPPRRERERTTSRSDLVLRQRIDELKHGVEIADVLRRYVELQPAGENMVGLCPFHEDHQPSLTVYPETGTFYCFGCRAHGDVIDFLRRKEGLSFREAIDALEGLSRRDGQAA